MSETLARLEATIASRRHASGEKSYVARQFAKGRLKIAEKLGEEAIETVIAGVAQDDQALVGEAADLLFHLMILLAEREIPLADVLAELDKREGVSGLDEKAGRTK